MSKQINIKKIFLANSEINVMDPVNSIQSGDCTVSTEMNCKSEYDEITYNEEKIYMVALQFQIFTEVENEPMYNMYFSQNGFFTLKGYEHEEEIEALAIDCPQILMPYARLHAEYLTKNTGLAPTLIQDIDFKEAYYKEIGKEYK